MRGNTYFFKVQDTTVNTSAIINPLLNSGLKVERNAIDLGSLRTVNTDTIKKVVVRKPKPIVKTPAVIPLNDSIKHPVYDVLTGQFKIADDKTFFDELSIAPFDPNEKANKPKAKPKAEINMAKPEKIFEVKESIKKGELVSTKDAKSVGFTSTDWMLGIIIISLIIFGWLRVGFSRFFNAAIQASYNYFTARRIFEEANVTRTRVFSFMNLLFFINIALFLTQYLDYNHISIFNAQGIFLFAICFVSFLVLYSVKSFIFYALDFIFLSRGAFSSYVFTVFLYNKMIGFVLLPIVSILPFVPEHITPWLFIAGGAVVAFCYIFRVFKGIQLCFKNRLSIFYLFLYLCALEILPLLILLKVLRYYF